MDSSADAMAYYPCEKCVLILPSNSFRMTTWKTILSLHMKNRCKLMYVVESFATGVYSVIKDLAGNLPCEEFEVVIVHSLRPDTPKTYKQDFSQKHVKLIYVPMDSAINDIRSIPRLIKIIKAEQPGVIHLHSSRAGFLGRLACKLTACRNVFYSPHGFSFLRCDVGKLTQKLFFCLEYIASLFGGVTVASSEGEFQQAARYTSRVVKIDNFVDTTVIEEISRKTESGTANLSTVGIAGRITPARNPEMFNQLAMALPDMKFVWIGDGPQKKHPKAHNVTITGFLPHNNAITEMAKLDVYIQTSLWEGMPIAVLEAMALGRPVVATDIIGNRDLISHGRTGFLAGTCDDFVRLIRMLIDDNSLRLRVGKAAAEHVKEHHDLHLGVKRYSKLYLSAGPQYLEDRHEKA